MGRIIAIVNQKGGVGKTTTNINTSAFLASKQKKTLTIDMDPQGNTTSGLGIDKYSLEGTLYNLLIGETFADNVILQTNVENLFLIPSNIDLAGAEIELINLENREYILKNILSKYNYLYDFITIDCPPSLNILTINALCAADSVLVPIQCEYFALEGLYQLMKTIEIVKKTLNKNLKIEGVVFTMYDSRTNLSMQVVEEVKKYLEKDVYTAIIPRSVRLSEAPSHGKPISLYDAKNKGAQAYEILSELIIK